MSYRHTLQHRHRSSSTVSQSSAWDVAVDSDNPLAWYKFEETSGTTITDIANGYDGTSSGSPTLGVAGKVGNAATFDGTNDYVTLPDLGTGGSFAYAEPISVECWLKFTGTSIQRVAGTLDTGTNMMFDHVVNMAGDGSAAVGRVTFRRRQSNDLRARASARNDLNDGNWHHFVATHLDDDSLPNIYVDGVLDNGTTFSASGPAGDSVFDFPFIIGAWNNRGTIDSFFAGSIDEYLLYTSELSSTRVGVHYSAA